MAERDPRRPSPGLNVYLNPHPEWSRNMVIGKGVSRKEIGARCPSCGSLDTRESYTRVLADFFLFFLDYTKARCRSCNRRFRVWKHGSEPGDTPPESNPENPAV